MENTAFNEKTIDALDRLQQSLRDLIDALKPQAEAPQDLTVYAVPQSNPGEAEPVLTLEDVREVLVAKAKAGKNDAVRDLLSRFHAASLPEVDPADYADLLEMGRKL